VVDKHLNCDQGEGGGQMYNTREPNKLKKLKCNTDGHTKSEKQSLSSGMDNLMKQALWPPGSANMVCARPSPLSNPELSPFSPCTRVTLVKNKDIMDFETLNQWKVGPFHSKSGKFEH